MKVVIQRPFLQSGAPLLGYVNSVFEAELRAPDGNGGWHVLQSLKPLAEPAHPDFPILHKGFFDSHLHMVWTGLFDIDLDLRECLTFEEALLKIQMKLHEGVSFVRGYGWDETRWNMTLGSLSRVAEEYLPEGKAIILYRVCGHAALANKTLRQSAGRAHLPALITDRDLPGVSERLPPPGQKECESAFLRAQSRVIDLGISSVGDMSLDETTAAALRQLAESGKLMVDVVGVVEGQKAPSIENTGPLYQKNSAAVGPLDRPASLCVQHWKKYLDGSLGSRTAWMTQPYDDSEGFGDSLIGGKQLIELSREALREGFYLSFHAIGDAALDQALEVGEKLGPLMGSRRETSSSSLPKSRHRIEHAQVVRDDQLARLASQGFWAACAQPHHRLGDRGFALARLGRSRYLSQSYRAASFLRSGVPLALSSDGPVDVADPRLVIQAAMTHENEAERLSFEDAVWWYTTGSRLELGLEPGKIGPGATVFLTKR